MERVYLAQITPADIALLAKAMEKQPDIAKIAPVEVINGVTTGAMELYRFPEGLMLIEITSENRMNVIQVSGEKMLFKFRHYAEQLQHRARELGCSKIETMVYNRHILNALKRAGAKPEAVNMVLEL